MRIAVIIPVKSFTVAKGRLSDTLTATQRQELAQSCAESVVMAARSFHTYVACSDSTVASWAISHGAHVVHCPTPGLDAAVAASRLAAQHDGFTHVIVAHADLPLAETFQHIAQEGTVTAVADRHRDGTNVLSFPIDSTFVTGRDSLTFILIDTDSLELNTVLTIRYDRIAHIIANSQNGIHV